MPPYNTGDLEGNGPWILSEIAIGSLQLVSTGTVESNADFGNYIGNLADAEQLDTLDPNLPWRSDYLVRFANDLGTFNRFTFLFGNGATPYFGFDIGVGSLLGDSLLHVYADGKFTHAPTTLANPAGKTILFTIEFDGTNATLYADGIAVFGPEPLSAADITEPYPEIGSDAQAQPGTIIVLMVHVAQ